MSDDTIVIKAPAGTGNPDWSNIMSLQYSAPSISAQWVNERETHIAVATAIHSIANNSRTPEVIWDDPTDAECDQVARAIEDYVDNGVFSAEPDGRYAWGQESVVISRGEHDARQL